MGAQRHAPVRGATVELVRAGLRASFGVRLLAAPGFFRASRAGTRRRLCKPAGAPARVAL